jgi:hypothetical protein
LERQNKKKTKNRKKKKKKKKTGALDTLTLDTRGGRRTYSTVWAPC